MEKRKISTTIYITPEQNRMLKVLNQKTKVPIAEFIREGIDLVLERNRSRLPGQMNLIHEEGAQEKPSGARRNLVLDI